jgi:hypothetical protein
MSTHHFHDDVSGPFAAGDQRRVEVHTGADMETLLDLADELVERLHYENPALVPQGEIILTELEGADEERSPANRGRIRFALDEISVGVSARSASLAITQELSRMLRV